MHAKVLVKNIGKKNWTEAIFIRYDCNKSYPVSVEINNTIAFFHYITKIKEVKICCYKFHARK